MCSLSALGACAPYSCASRSQRLLVVGLSHDVLEVHLRLHRSRCQHFSWFDPAFKFVVVSDSVDQSLSTFFVPQETTTCRERGSSIVPLVTKLAHTHGGSIDLTHLERDSDLASIPQFHSY